MTIDDPALHERTFTETHDRILHALVEQVHDMSIRLKALEAQSISAGDRLPSTQPQDTTRVPAPAVDLTTTPPAPREHATKRPQPNRQAGWQPTRR